MPEDFAADAGDSKVTLTWSPYSSSTTYNIYRSTDPDCNLTNYLTACSASALFTNIAPSFVDTNLTNATTYHYWIEAILSGVTQHSTNPISATPWQYIPLNDTGIDWGADYESGNNSECTSNIDAPQDCHQGRDVTHNDDSDGHAGFSFTRLNADGSIYTGDGNYTTNPWSCVQDNVTGFIWEVKTDDNSEHDKNNRYRWGGITAIDRDSPNREGEYYDDWNDIVNAANSEELCGFTDWHVPSMRELMSIVDYAYGSPSIDTNYFPNTVSISYWSALPYSLDSNNAVVRSFGGGGHFHTSRTNNKPVRLVRSGNSESTIDDWPNERYQLHGDGTVTDKETRLMWMQCSFGQDSASNCSGDAEYYNWQEALEAAKGYSFAAYSDWRLPNIKELYSIVAEDRNYPSINSAIFPNAQNSHWSASPYSRDENWSWRLYFGGIGRVDRSDSYHIRLVRNTILDSNTTDSNETAAPATPSAPTIFHTASNSIELNWSSVDAATYYQLFQNTSHNSSSANIVYQGSATYTNQDNLDPNTTYYYWLKACNSAGCSDFSQASSVITDDHGNTRSAATSVDLNSSTSGTIEIDDDIDYFEIVLPHGGYLFIYAEGSLDTVFGMLENSNGSTLDDDFQDGADDKFAMTNYLDAGTYYVRIESHYYTGQYTLHVEFDHSIDDDHSNTIADATSIDLNSSIPGEIEIDNDIDYFEVVLTQSGDLTVYTEGSLDTYGWLEDSNGSIIAENDDSGDSTNFSISSYLDASTYYIRVESFNNNYIGEYTLHTTFEARNINQAPTAIISISPDPASTTLTTATEVTLEANASTDPDGDQLNYTWSQPSDQSIFLNSSTTSSTTFIATTAGTYTFTLTVSDGELFDSTEVNLTISSSILPDEFLANAGDADVTLTWSPYSTSTIYNIYRSTDPDCNLINYLTACSASALFSSVAPGFADTNLTNATTYYYWIEAILNGVTQRSINPISATPWQYIPLNDTGIDWGGNYQSDHNADCSSDIDAPQDCHHGRDATHNDDSDGHAGFSFTRLNADGSIYTGDGNYTSNPWSCVQDNVTGLIWEVKTDDDSERDKYNFHRWGGLTSINRDSPDREGDYYDDWNVLVSHVNSESLCGFNDWRVPDIEELRSIVDHSRASPSIDIDYFPNSISSFWSASPAVHGANSAWGISLSQGVDWGYSRDAIHVVRLVRSSYDGGVANDWPNERFQVHGDGTVTDKQTGLMWMRCSLGQNLQDNCSGYAYSYDWQEALESARDFSLANYSDWRLPNINELSSLVARDRHSPAINSAIFPDTQSITYPYYWSSTPPADNDGGTKTIYFIDGDDGYTRSTDSIPKTRLVRDSNTNDSNETTTPATPSAPTILYATNNSIELNWSIVNSATYYQLFQNTSNNSSSANLVYQGSITYTIQDNLDSNTTYYYWLKACNSAGCSDFSQSSSVTTDDHGNTRSDATSVDLNSSISGAIEVEDDIDYFEVVLPHDGYLFIDIEASLDTDARLEESDGSILNDDYSIGTDNNLSMSNYLYAGTYYVRIESYRDTGQYTLHVEFDHDIDDDHSNTRADATSIDLNSSIAGTIEIDDDIDYFEVALPHDGYLFIHIEAFLDDTDASLEESDGSYLDHDYSSSTDNNLSMANYLDAGTYYVRIESYRDTGQYTLYVEFDHRIDDDHANAIAEATSIDLNSSIAGTIEINIMILITSN